MKTIILIFLCVFSYIACAEQLQSNPGSREKISFEKLRKEFAEPDMLYAPFFFWFWDTKLNPEICAKMAEKMLEQHCNPGYAHARWPMVPTPSASVEEARKITKKQWLTKDWFDAFSAALEVTEKNNGYLGYCDEYWWPSGQAAGRLLKKHPDLNAKYLSWTTFNVKNGKTIELPVSLFTVAARLAPDSKIEKADVPSLYYANWIWHPAPESIQHRANGTFNNKCRLKTTFNIDKKNSEVTKAIINITVDNSFILYINGKKVGENTDWEKISEFNIKKFLKQGKNILEVQAIDDGGAFGLIASAEITFYGNKILKINSDSNWLAATTEKPEWVPAKEIATSTDAPWNIVKVTHQTTTIISETLKVIGEGKSFQWTPPSDGNWRIYSFKLNDHNTPDYMNKRLGPVFCKMVEEPYAKHFAGKLGKSIPGVFNDNEGHFPYKIGWSKDMVSLYKEKTGRDIRKWIPLLFDKDVEGKYARTRCEWYDTATDLYAQFFKASNDWLTERGMYYIANLWEESLIWQLIMVPDFFKLQRVFSMPGTDCLQEKALDVHDFKEAQSVAEFENRRLQSEIMGAGGWKSFNPVFLKKAVNSLTTWGVSHIVPHCIFMNRRLEGNPWTPDWYDENPLFKYLYLWADFTRRTSYINSHGRTVPEVLLLNPMESICAIAPPELFDPAITTIIWNEKDFITDDIFHIDKVYSTAIRDLTKNRIDFLIADKHYIRQMRVVGNNLVRDEFKFKTIILPPLVVLPIDVAEKILDFAQRGGKVFALGELPLGSTDNGMNDPKMKVLMNNLEKQKSFKFSKKKLPINVPGLQSRIEFISGAFDMLQQHRRIDDRDFFWLANNADLEQECEIEVFEVSGRAEIWNCENGKVISVMSQKSKTNNSRGLANVETQRLKLSFCPYEAYWLVFNPKQKSIYKLHKRIPSSRIIQKITGDWYVKIDPSVQPNLEIPVKLPREFTRMNKVEKSLTLWSEWKMLDKKFTGFIDYTKVIECNSISKDVILSLGTVYNMAEVWINGKHAGAKLWPPYEFEVGELLKIGKNKIKIRIGNLTGNNYGVFTPSGLSGPVELKNSHR